MKTGTSQIWELIYGGEPTKSQMRKTMGIYYSMVVVCSFALHIANKIWHFNDKIPWWGLIIGGYFVATGLFLFYVYVYKGFLRSRHKLWFVIGFIAFVLFKLMPYILGWQKF